MDRKTILIHSAAPWCPSGYGQQTAQLALRLQAAGYDVHVSAHYGLEGAKLTWNDIPVWPGSNDFGARLLPRYLKAFEPDLAITLLDVWTLNAIAADLKGHNLASWVPIDHEPLGEPIAKFLKESGSRPIAMSRHGEKQLVDAGFDPLYVPHAIDTTNVFRPRDRDEARDLLHVPRDAFLAVMVAANMDSGPSRKGYLEALQAFKIFHDRHDDAVLYLHTDLEGRVGGGSGVNIGWLCERIGVEPEWLKATPPLKYELGVPAEFLAELYSAGDVLLAPSYGEGFGIPVIEAQACGMPVIVGGSSAQPELVGAGWVVPGQPCWVDRYRAWWKQPSVEAMVDALEQAYEARGTLGDAAVEFASLYDADRVYNLEWAPVLGELLAPPKLNRQMRRAGKRGRRRERVAA